MLDTGFPARRMDLSTRIEFRRISALLVVLIFLKRELEAGTERLDLLVAQSNHGVDPESQVANRLRQSLSAAKAMPAERGPLR